MADEPKDTVDTQSDTEARARLVALAERTRAARAAHASSEMTAVAAVIDKQQADAPRSVPCGGGCGATVRQQPTGIPTAPWFPVRPKCPACSGAAEKMRQDEERRQALAAAQRAARLTRLREALALPIDYQGVTLDSYRRYGTDDEQKVQADVIRMARLFVAEWSTRLRADTDLAMLLLLYGPPGTGKTRIALGIASEVVEQHEAEARWVKFPTLVREVQETFGRDEPTTETKVLQRYRAPELLVIDEASRHALLGGLESKRRHLYEVLEDRILAHRPTILTSNEATDDDVADMLGPALYSRLAQYSGAVPCGWSDFRDVIRQQRRRRLATKLRAMRASES